MLGKNPNQNQLDLFKAALIELLNPQHPLVSLASYLPWKPIEQKFQHLYSNTGAPSHPLRLMVGLTLLQRIYNLSDERIVQLWKENPYFQFFCGKDTFQWQQPCAASDLVHFRKRIGKQGIQYLFSLSIHLHHKKVQKAKEVIVDTTVQEKNVTFPTDAKLYRKVIERCNAMAKQAGFSLRQSYKFVVKKLVYAQRCTRTAKQAVKKLRTLAGRQLRDLQRNLSAAGQLEGHQQLLSVMERIVKQRKNDKGKVYSLSSPEVSCIAKGKTHKKYEFGSKVSLATLPGSNVVVGILNYKGNPHDSKTLPSTMAMVERCCGKRFDRVIVDRGYRRCVKVGATEVILPDRGKSMSVYERRRHKARCRSRSSIEAIIGHLKQGHGLGRNYLKGSIGDELNGLLAGIGFNLKLLLRELADGCTTFFVLLVKWLGRARSQEITLDLRAYYSS